MDWSDPHKVASDEGRAEGQESRPGTHWLYCRPSLGRCWPSGLTPTRTGAAGRKVHPRLNMEGGTGRFQKSQMALEPFRCGSHLKHPESGQGGPRHNTQALCQIQASERPGDTAVLSCTCPDSNLGVRVSPAAWVAGVVVEQATLRRGFWKAGSPGNRAGAPETPGDMCHSQAFWGECQRPFGFPQPPAPWLQSTGP